MITPLRKAKDCLRLKKKKKRIVLGPRGDSLQPEGEEKEEVPKDVITREMCTPSPQKPLLLMQGSYTHC